MYSPYWFLYLIIFILIYLDFIWNMMVYNAINGSYIQKSCLYHSIHKYFCFFLPLFQCLPSTMCASTSPQDWYKKSSQSLLPLGILITLIYFFISYLSERSFCVGLYSALNSEWNSPNHPCSSTLHDLMSS